jgi:hypothetical protein
VADIGLLETYQLFCEVIQFLEVVAGVCNLVRLEAKPLDGVENGLEVNFFLGLRICVVVSAKGRM